MHNDEPALLDTLERGELIKEVGDAIARCTPPQVFGVHGDWGLGKTSFLHQVQWYLTGDCPQQPVSVTRDLGRRAKEAAEDAANGNGADEGPAKAMDAEGGASTQRGGVYRDVVQVEQLLGRVPRMPYAERRRLSDLNRAHAFVSEPSFGAPAHALADKLVAMGFEEDEAYDSIEPAQPELGGPGGPFEPREETGPRFLHAFDASARIVSALKELERDGVTVQETEDGGVEVAVAGRVGAELVEAILRIVPRREQAAFARAVAEYRVNLGDVPKSPAEQGEEFNVPRLMSAMQGTS